MVYFLLIKPSKPLHPYNLIYSVRGIFFIATQSSHARALLSNVSVMLLDKSFDPLRIWLKSDWWFHVIWSDMSSCDDRFVESLRRNARREGFRESWRGVKELNTLAMATKRWSGLIYTHQRDSLYLSDHVIADSFPIHRAVCLAMLHPFGHNA